MENPTILLDLFGLAPWGAGEQSFDLWWKKAKQKTVQKYIASVKRHLRAGGGKHEMFPVSLAMDAKRLGFTPSELRRRLIQRMLCFIMAPIEANITNQLPVLYSTKI